MDNAVSNIFFSVVDISIPSAPHFRFKLRHKPSPIQRTGRVPSGRGRIPESSERTSRVTKIEIDERIYILHTHARDYVPHEAIECAGPLYSLDIFHNSRFYHIEYNIKWHRIARLNCDESTPGCPQLSNGGETAAGRRAAAAAIAPAASGAIRRRGLAAIIASRGSSDTLDDPCWTQAFPFRFPRRTVLGHPQPMVARDLHQVVSSSSGRSSYTATSSSESPIKTTSSPADIGSTNDVARPLPFQLSDFESYVDSDLHSVLDDDPDPALNSDGLNSAFIRTAAHIKTISLATQT
ncbi:hypothetical protein EVAR_34342_1 [Eumeta japonica]|uniref:Uncharacterized protein n=1 Tax=Eumeta variegata TaxID=151549 RepID=A0A4C1VBS0_EUMVA|nr:hypothetical protein EVAR_34342_1 [Eumeta japonica]